MRMKLERNFADCLSQYCETLSVFRGKIMNIAILGAGNIGGVVWEKWVKAGHTVQYGLRNPDKPEIQDLIKSLGKNASASSMDEAINFGEVVVFAIPGPAMAETIT